MRGAGAPPEYDYCNTFFSGYSKTEECFSPSRRAAGLYGSPIPLFRPLRRFSENCTSGASKINQHAALPFRDAVRDLTFFMSRRSLLVLWSFFLQVFVSPTVFLRTIFCPLLQRSCDAFAPTSLPSFRAPPIFPPPLTCLYRIVLQVLARRGNCRDCVFP